MNKRIQARKKKIPEVTIKGGGIVFIYGDTAAINIESKPPQSVRQAVKNFYVVGEHKANWRIRLIRWLIKRQFGTNEHES